MTNGERVVCTVVVVGFQGSEVLPLTTKSRGHKETGEVPEVTEVGGEVPQTGFPIPPNGLLRIEEGGPVEDGLDEENDEGGRSRDLQGPGSPPRSAPTPPGSDPCPPSFPPVGRCPIGLPHEPDPGTQTRPFPPLFLFQIPGKSPTVGPH